MFGQATPREFVQFLLRMRTGNLLSPASQEIFWDTLRIQKYIEPMRKLLPAVRGRANLVSQKQSG